MGMDHYLENLNSHSWPTDLNTYMNLMSIKQWIKLFKDCGVSQIVPSKLMSHRTFRYLGFKGKKL